MDSKSSSGKRTEKFERRITGRIFGPVMGNNIERIRHNEEITVLLEGQEINSRIYQVTEIKMVGAYPKNGRQCSADEDDERETVIQTNKRKTQDEMARRCRE
jgi:hypothetical protein